MKRLDYMQELDDDGYLFDPTVFDQESHWPKWDEHCYECIASSLVDAIDLDGLAQQIVQASADAQNPFDSHEMGERYAELFCDLAETLDKLWEIIEADVNQCVFVRNKDFFAMFDNTFVTRDIGEFSIAYGNKEYLCGSSATYVWNIGFSSIIYGPIEIYSDRL